MLPNERAQPASPAKPAWPGRALATFRRAPAWVKVGVLLLFWVWIPGTIVVGLVYAVIAVIQGHRNGFASASVALWGISVLIGVDAKGTRGAQAALLLLPVVVALAAHARPLSRWFVPCRTTAWALAWSLPVAVIALKVSALARHPAVAIIASWVLALAVLGYRTAKGFQDGRLYPGGPAPSGPQASGRRGAGDGTAPNGPRPAGGPGGPGGPGTTGPGRGYPGSHPGYGARAQAAAMPYAEHAGRDHQPGPPRPRPQISVEDAMAELDAMIGLAPVKEQVRSIAASIEAARRRAMANIS